MSNAKMGLRAWWDKIGTENVRKALELTGDFGQVVKESYARQCRAGSKTMGRQSALALVEAAKVATPGWVPDLELLLRGEEKLGLAAQRIEPSPEFLASMEKPKKPAAKAKKPAAKKKAATAKRAR